MQWNLAFRTMDMMSFVCFTNVIGEETTTFCSLMLFYYKIIQVNDLINYSNNNTLKYISNLNLRSRVEVDFIWFIERLV